MIGLLKALLGVATVGGGVVLPVAMSQSNSGVNTDAVAKLRESLGKTGKALGQVANKYVGTLLEVSRQEKVKSQENSNFSEVFKKLRSEECQLVQNPAVSKDDFHAIYACKKAADKNNKNVPTIFYYLGARDSVKEMSKGAMKEIETINYEDDGQIMLKLKDNEQKISISVVAGEGGWSNFKDVNLSKQCQIETKRLGGDDLRCELTDTQGKTFFYNFSIL